MTVSAVCAYAQNLSTPLFEPAVVNPEGRDLVASGAGKVEHVEGQYHVLLPFELAQAYLLIDMGGKCKIWGWLSDLCWHCVPPVR